MENNIIRGRYYGKQNDCISAVLEMTLEHLGYPYVSHLDCLTTRPFGWIYCQNEPKKFVAPLKTPWEGIIDALNTLNVDYRSRSIEMNHDSHDINEILADMGLWLEKGPVIIGPVNKTMIWNRLPSIYYHGDAHYILVIKSMPENYYLVHDPEGCPYFNIHIDTMKKAMETTEGTRGAIQLTSLPIAVSINDVLLDGLVNGLRCHMMAENHENGGVTGLTLFTNYLRSNNLKSSEEASLHFALSALGIALARKAEFFLDIALITNPTSELETLSNRASVILQGYLEIIAKSIHQLATIGQENLVPNFIEMTRYQLQLAHLYSDLNEVLEHGRSKLKRGIA